MQAPNVVRNTLTRQRGTRDHRHRRLRGTAAGQQTQRHLVEHTQRHDQRHHRAAGPRQRCPVEPVGKPRIGVAGHEGDRRGQPPCVNGMPATAGAATPAVTPGTTRNGMPAAPNASASSPPRPNT